MAIDIRRSNNRATRRWLEKNLLVLEDRGVIEATLERRPPHYHVAVFPDPYARYVAAKTGGRTLDPAPGEGGGNSTGDQTYRVRSGDSLWVIARRFGTSVGDLRRANELRSTRIYPGQKLRIPAD
jgi:LysM repeat protein